MDLQANLEDVSLSMHLPGVKLVEESHHDECIEDDCEVLRGRGEQGRVQT